MSLLQVIFYEIKSSYDMYFLFVYLVLMFFGLVMMEVFDTVFVRISLTKESFS